MICLIFALTALREKAERKLDDNTIEALRKHIEALQAENEQLQAQVARMRDIKCRYEDLCQKLRAQVARLREAITVANNYMPDIGQFCACGKCKTCGADINYVGYVYCVKCARAIIDTALSDTPAE